MLTLLAQAAETAKEVGENARNSGSHAVFVEYALKADGTLATIVLTAIVTTFFNNRGLHKRQLRQRKEQEYTAISTALLKFKSCYRQTANAIRVLPGSTTFNAVTETVGTSLDRLRIAIITAPFLLREDAVELLGKLAPYLDTQLGDVKNIEALNSQILNVLEKLPAIATEDLEATKSWWPRKHKT